MKENPHHNIPFHSILSFPKHIIILLNFLNHWKIQKKNYSKQPKLAPTCCAVYKQQRKYSVVLLFKNPHKRFYHLKI